MLVVEAVPTFNTDLRLLNAESLNINFPVLISKSVRVLLVSSLLLKKPSVAPAAIEPKRTVSSYSSPRIPPYARPPIPPTIGLVISCNTTESILSVSLPSDFNFSNTLTVASDFSGMYCSRDALIVLFLSSVLFFLS